MGLPTDGLVVYAYTVLWITVSAGVILYNKWILNGFGFPFPVALTMIHMALCSALAFILVRVLKVVEGVNMTKDMYIRKIVPVAFLFSIVLWLGNSAYLYLSVAFIQMVKALMPCVVYLVGVSFKIETFKVGTMANMVILAIGIAVASYGELNFHAFGFTLLIASILAEAIRIVSIQLLLTASDIKLNSVTTLYYVSPACFVFLTLPFVFLELPAMLDAEDIKTNPLVLLSSAVLAFALNMSVYLLIGKTSALTMNVAGVIKDWLLICISSMLFDAPISSMQLLGYLLAFVAVCYYNYQKYLERAAKEKHLTAEASETMYDKCFHFPDTPETRRCILILLIFCAFAGILIREGPLSVTSSHFGTNLVDSILSTNSDVHKQITRRPPNDILVQRNKTICLTPSLPRHTFHVVIGGFDYLTDFEEHYIWDIGLPNIDIFVYRRTELEKPLRSWAGPCGAQAAEKLLVPNYGRDGAAFYDYVVENYGSPPVAFAFLHGHVAHSWHTSCKALFTRLTRYYMGLSEPLRYPNLHGMVTLTSKPDGQDDDPFDWYGGRRRKLKEIDIPSEVGLVLNHHNITLVENGFNSCCATFIVPGGVVGQHSYDFYLSLRELLMNQTLDDQLTGRHGFEFIVYRLFTTPTALKDNILQWYESANMLSDDARVSRQLETCKRTH